MRFWAYGTAAWGTKLDGGELVGLDLYVMVVVMVVVIMGRENVIRMRVNFISCATSRVLKGRDSAPPAEGLGKRREKIISTPLLRPFADTRSSLEGMITAVASGYCFKSQSGAFLMSS